MQTVELEVKAYAERTKLFNVSTAGSRMATVVRVQYRKQGTRRWTRFFLVPHEGQTIDELLDRAEDVAREHHAKADQTAPGGEA